MSREDGQVTLEMVQSLIDSTHGGGIPNWTTTQKQDAHAALVALLKERKRLYNRINGNVVYVNGKPTDE